MRNVLTFFLTISILSACTHYITDDNKMDETIETHRSYIMPIEDAISELYSTLDAIYDKSDTKSSSEWAIRDIEIVPRNLNDKIQTKSSNGDDPLMYLINFEDGYAVLATDTRLSSTVLAIVDNGSISVSDFMFNYSSVFEFDENGELDDFDFYDEEEDDCYVGNPNNGNIECQMMFDYASNPDGEQNHQNLSVIYGEWTVDESVSAMLTTVWHQDSPFNDACPMRGFPANRSRSYTGCVATALGQIIAYHEYPTYFIANGYNVNWHDIKNPSSGPISTYDKAAVANFMLSIGQWCNMLYTKNWSFALPTKAKNCLQIFGYSNVQNHHGYDEDKIIEMLDGDNPVFIAAISKLVNGHAWVIDGYKKRSREIQLYDNLAETVLETSSETSTLLHCNWGWGGIRNGYYASGIFNTTKAIELDNEKEESTINDNYTWWFRVLTYDNPNNNEN